MTMPLRRLSTGPDHHFFGFHDISCWSHDGHRIAALRARDIRRLPGPANPVTAGYLDHHCGTFHALLDTCAYNYPQGARQLWCPDGSMWVNTLDGDHWAAVRVDCTGEVLQTVPQALFCMQDDAQMAWGLNFTRLNRLLGYGYVGLPDKTAAAAAPDDDGLWSVDLCTGQVRLLLSIRDAAQAQNGTIGRGHHYLTHAVLSPNQRRLLFLHRYWLGDGGLHHRLMSVAVDGSDLQVHCEGFLSHFDWQDNDRVIIWGRAGAGIDRLRRSPVLQIPGVRRLARKVKQLLRGATAAVPALQMSYLQVDVRTQQVWPFHPGLLKEDGHPMFRPGAREWMSVDNYPDAQGVRTLWLLHDPSSRLDELGRFKMLDLQPESGDLSMSLEHVAPEIAQAVGGGNIAFWRSGIHCDLHPRWSRDGRYLCFDSTHEGSRQMYLVDTTKLETTSTEPAK